MVRIRVLRSGPTGGNITLIWNNDTAILIDCGVGPRIVDNLLERQGLSLADITGILITHSHGDHIKPRAIEKLFDNKVPVYCSDGVKKAMKTKIKHRKTLTKFPAKVFRIGSFKVKPFKVNHDSNGGCVGYCIYEKIGKLTHKITLATDFGNPGKRAIQHMHNSHGLLLTSDHDTKMLERSYDIPEEVKADHIIPYHLSNEQCANLLVRVIKSSRIKPEFIYLLHISEKINTVKKALARSRQSLRNAGYDQIKVLPSYSYEPSRISQLG